VLRITPDYERIERISFGKEKSQPRLGKKEKESAALTFKGDLFMGGKKLK